MRRASGRSRGLSQAEGGSRDGALSSLVVTRRIAVLTTGAVLLVVFGLLGTLLPVPYVAQVPGPTFNTLGDLANFSVGAAGGGVITALISTSRSSTKETK